MTFVLFHRRPQSPNHPIVIINNRSSMKNRSIAAAAGHDDTDHHDHIAT
jgi:hypothetical protein